MGLPGFEPGTERLLAQFLVGYIFKVFLGSFYKARFCLNFSSKYVDSRFFFISNIFKNCQIKL